MAIDTQQALLALPNPAPEFEPEAAPAFAESAR